MPTELEDLVGFLHHGNADIRLISSQNLVGYSTAQPSLFKHNQLEPIRDLKLLVNDYGPIAKNALTILVNISQDEEVLRSLVDDDAFLASLLRRVTDENEPNADEMCALLANLAKSATIIKLLTLKRDLPKKLSTSPLAIDQLLDCFVKGAAGSYNKHANYDYLSYLFADLAKDPKGCQHFLSPREEDGDVVPLSKLIVFTEHKSVIRRRGVANTIKNICFDIPGHTTVLLADESEGGVGLLPYILLPLMGSETYSDDDMEGMLDECQLLPPDKGREAQADIICTHLDTLLLLTTTREGRKRLRDVQVYPIVRELHLQVDNEDVGEGCDRLVQVLMRGEEGEPEVDALPEATSKPSSQPEVQEVEEDEDDLIVEV